MLNPFTSIFQGCACSLDSTVDFKELKRTKAFVYRDELSENFEGEKSVSKKGDFCNFKGKDDGGATAAEMRVKVRMTKEEAARLLAMCKDGGFLEFKDVARELVEIPASRVSVENHRNFSIGTAGKRVVLETIPE